MFILALLLFGFEAADASGAVTCSLPGDSALLAHYTFSQGDRLADSAGGMGRLTTPHHTPSFQSDCQWPGAQCAVLHKNDKIGGQYFRMPAVNLGVLNALDGFSICVW